MSSVKVCLALLLVFATIMVEPILAAPFEHWTVHVLNEMGGGQSLFLHCKSKDDDLGEQNVEVGQEFSWGFKENLWQTTLYWCYMRNQNNGHVSMEVFWPESHEWLYSRCNHEHCIWSARDDGIYLKNIPEDKFEFSTKWEPGW